MPKIKVWMWLLLVLVLVIGYGGAKYLQYSREWKQFDDAWKKVGAGLTGSYGSNWKPDFFSATGEMDLSDCGLTDEKLAHLQGVTTLVRLDISDNDVTDVGINHLSDLTSLRKLDLRGTHVSEDTVQSLRRALPNCEIAR